MEQADVLRASSHGKSTISTVRGRCDVNAGPGAPTAKARQGMVEFGRWPGCSATAGEVTRALARQQTAKAKVQGQRASPSRRHEDEDCASARSASQPWR